jgi:hypothetical protein
MFTLRDYRPPNSFRNPEIQFKPGDARVRSSVLEYQIGELSLKLAIRHLRINRLLSSSVFVFGASRNLTFA